MNGCFLRICLWRIQQGDIDVLARGELELLWFLETKGHGAFGNGFSTRQFDHVGGGNIGRHRSLLI